MSESVDDESNYSGQDGSHQNEQKEDESNAFDKLCAEENLAPAFTRFELTALTVEKLKIITDHWQINLRSRARKTEIIDAILRHENNADPEWVGTLKLAGALIPRFKKAELKRHKISE